MAAEELIVKIISQLAEKFKNSLILKGGILLRLLNSPRSTQDIDYAWIRTKKRNLFGTEVKAALEQLDDVRVVDMKANSRGIFLDAEDSVLRQKAMVEIGVIKSTNLAPKPISTAPLANRYGAKAQIITAIDPAEAFSDKIAASLERELVRDLYDLTQLEPITTFDPKTLQGRLNRLEVGRRKARKVTIQEAIQMFQEKSKHLSQKRIEDELAGLLPPEQLPGLETLIRATVARITQRMEALAE